MFISPINLSKIAIALFLLTVSFSVNAQQVLRPSVAVSKNINFSNNVNLQQTVVSASTVFKSFGDKQSLKGVNAGVPQFEINITSDYKATYGCTKTIGTNSYVFTNTAPKTETGENFASDIIIDLGASFDEVAFNDKNATLRDALNNSAHLTAVRVNGYRVYDSMLEYVDGRYRINFSKLYDPEMAHLFGLFDLDNDGQYDDLPAGASLRASATTSPKCKHNNQGYNAARIVFNNSLGTNLEVQTKKSGHNLTNSIANEPNELIVPNVINSGTSFDVAFNAKALFNPNAYTGGKNQYSELELVFSQKIDFSTISFSDDYGRVLTHKVSTDNKRLTVKIPFLNQENQELTNFKINGLLLNCFNNSVINIDWAWRYVCEDCNTCKINWVSKSTSFQTTGCVPFDIAVNQEVDEQYPYVDETVVFTVKVKNNSGITAGNIEIESLLPSGYEFISAETRGEYFDIDGIWTLASLASKKEETIKITARVLAVGDYTNIATLKSYEGGEDAVPANNSSSITTYPIQPRLELVQEAVFNDENNDGYAQIDETISYSFKIKNTGNTPVKEIIVTDSVINIIGDKIVQLSENKEIKSSFSGVYTITQNDINLGAVYNRANVLGYDIRGNEVKNDTGVATDYSLCQYCSVTHLPQNQAVSFVKSYTLADTNNDGVLGTLNDVITYQFTVQNTGNTTLTNITITDPFLGVEDVSILPAILQPNEITSLTLAYAITEEDVSRGYVKNTATVRAQNPVKEDDIVVVDSDSGTDFDGEAIENPHSSETPDVNGNHDNNPTNDPTITRLKGEIDLTITKTVDNLEPVVGSQVTFTITVKNNGNIPAKNIEVVDELPSGYEYVSHTTVSSEYSDITGKWIIDELTPQGTITLTVLAKVLESGDYENIATIISHQSNEVGSASVKPLCLTVYNEFSPNGDGKNEYFHIDCIQNYANNSLSVLNRWGNAVYERYGYDNSWNGIANKGKSAGKALPAGTYYYVLKLGEDKDDITGWLYINR